MTHWITLFAPSKLYIHVGALENTILEFDPLGETFKKVGHISQDPGHFFAMSVIKLSDYLEWCILFRKEN